MAIAAIPYGAYWSTPFVRWQGAFADLHAVEFAAWTGRQALAKRGVPLEAIDLAVLGLTVPQKSCFYGAPWLMALMGAGHVGGPTVSQACATSARAVQVAALDVQAGAATTALVVTADRVSNGPQLVYPRSGAPGGAPDLEHWVLGNFERDPFVGCAMVTTAENVARRHAITLEEQHDVVLQRFAQYGAALDEDRAFQRRYMDLPFDVPDPRFRKTVATLDGDAGIYPTTAEKIATLKPVVDGGTVTFAAQTHPADGNAGMIVTTPERAAELSRDKAVTIAIRGFGLARAEPGYMPAAPVPATARALAQAGVSITQVDCVKSHNPFAVNDIVFARETGFPLVAMNNYGCSLVWGHPQGPTGLRAMIELIEELVLRGGGIGLFQGCAAGDTAMAVVLEVGGTA
jgi:acetyl-CoA acetyltransferase